jgi:hypothetical protein
MKFPVGRGHGEVILLAAHRDRTSVDPGECRIGLELPPGGQGDLGGADTVLPEKAMREIGEAVAPLAGIDHFHIPAGAQELQGGSHSGVAAPDDNHIMHLSHLSGPATQCAAAQNRRPGWQA